MQSYLNELSLPILHSAEEVITLFEGFKEYYKRAQTVGIREVKVQDAFFTYQLAPGYNFYDWTSDKRADEDLRTLLKSVFGTAPSVDFIFENYQKGNDTPLEIKSEGQPSIGLGLASDKMFNTVAFSFNAQVWHLSSYIVHITATIEGDDDGNLSEITYTAKSRNISSSLHVDTHQNFINEKVVSTIESGAQLWHNRKSFFPNLVFCASTRQQIESLDIQSLQFDQIIQRLFDLQNVAADFDGTLIRPEMFPTKTSPESTTRENKLAAQLTFKCPDGVDRLFTWHCRFTPNAGRIHFIAYEQQKICLIGYIGQKIN